MSTAIMKVEEVINKCNACISAIDEARAADDENDRLRKMDEFRKSDLFWNKITFGWTKIRSEEQLRIDAHNYLLGSDSGSFNIRFGFYPNTILYGKWRKKAQDLLRLANHSELDVMHVDEEGAVVINWT